MAILREDISFRYLKQVFLVNVCFEQQDSVLQVEFTYLKRQKCYGPDKKILFKKQLFDLEVKGQGPTKVVTVRDPPPYGV
jgi:polysaccharide pyruvyl transferase WcaK-like protein